MENKRVIILVLAADVSGYDQLVQSIKNTWASSKLDSFEILYYYGYRDNHPRPEPGVVIRLNDDLICGYEESIPNINAKTFASFNYVYNNYDFDYVYRCCAGSYIEQKNLAAFIQDKPANNFYCGVIGNADGIPFASGSGYFLSRDLVKLLIDNPCSFYTHHIDDVAIGKFLGEKGVQVVAAPRQDFDDGVIHYLDKSQYHYHFRRNVGLMHQIHQMLDTESK